MSVHEPWQVADDAAVLYERSFVPAIFERSAAMLADAARIARGDRVLDVGCGTGVVAREAARRIEAAGRVIGLDLNPRMLEVARQVAPEIEWRQGDAGELPFEDGAFDVVVSQYALMFFPDQAAGLREMQRVLQAGGRLAIAVCGPLADAGAYTMLAEVAERICSPEVVDLLRSPFALGDRGRLADLVGAADLDGAEIRTLETPVRFPSIEALVHTEIKASPIRNVIDERTFDALLKGARKHLAAFCVNGKEISFGLPVHVVTARKG